MLAEARQRAILRHLGDAGAVRVAQLSETLSVTEETIRRDLDKLARDGRVMRTHGGAVLPQSESRDLPFVVRETANLEAKQEIARLALRFVGPNDVIALDASSTVHQLAQILIDKPITVVTNALPATVVLAGRPHIRLVSTGGFLDHGSSSWTGRIAEQALQKLNINTLFLSSAGLDLTRGLSEVDDDQRSMKRHMLDLAERVVLMVDFSKLGVRGAVQLADQSEVDLVLTDARADERFVAALRRSGVNVQQWGDDSAGV